jgi:drug/metabolite transporter (DMT)-like permease
VRAAPSLWDYVLLIGLSLIFGASFIFTDIGVSHLPPMTVATTRLIIAFLLMYAVMKVMRQSLPASGKIWIYIILSAATGNAVPFVLISWGQVKVEAGLTAIFMAIMPLATIVVANFFTDDEKLNRWKIAGVTCGVAGIVVLIGPGALADIGDNTIRQLAILCAALCYAVNAVITRQLTSLPRLPMITAILMSASAMLIIPTLVIDQPWQQTFTAAPVLSIVILAIGPTAFATWLILTIIDRQGASFMSQINFMVPLFGVAMGSLFLHERLPVNAYLALLIILLALALSRRGTSAS